MNQADNGNQELAAEMLVAGEGAEVRALTRIPGTHSPRQFRPGFASATPAKQTLRLLGVSDFVRSLFVVLLRFAILVFVAGCGSFRLSPDPEVAPSGNSARSWTPPGSISIANEAAPTLAELRTIDEGNRLQALNPGGYDLPALVDLALRTNPQTRRAWYAAQAANAQLGQSQAANYPNIEFDGDGDYLKLPIQFPGQTLIIRNEAFLPQLKVSYDLLDFGRTRAAEHGSREQLIAANFAFNRTIQDVVFNVEKAYYVLSAAKASVSAAESNLKLARTSLAAVQERHHAGLATKPQILMAKQLEAQAIYDLENAKSMVHDAESILYEAVGVAPDVYIAVQNIDHQNVPENLGDDVEKLMDDALKNRPDVAAQIAAVRATDAAIDEAESQFYPEVGVSGNYGQIIWSYTVNGGSTQNLNQPFYGALLTLRWNLFTGFDRYYGVQGAIAKRNLARSELRSLELGVVATVSRAYYDFTSAKKKYDASEALLAASQESYDSNLESHRHGLATITDLLGAERDLMGARYTLVQSQADLLVSSSALVHSVGAESASNAPQH
ncbi:MAG TPA: TolC family protein [Candidatus Binataceae bacterium]|nr:TolC family protein [Candidatus Binataceae bacterium]